jgi:ABC-type transport system involved in cytochrome c biogenesis permease subunit
VFGFVGEVLFGKRQVLAAAATISALMLVLADNLPRILDPGIQPLESMPRGNFWLVTHGMAMNLGYAALALAVGLANTTLGHYLLPKRNPTVIRSLSRFTCEAIQIGVVLLAVGIILGGVWADASSGRFWSGDAKEAWALVALVGYVAVLHARFAGWIGHRGLASLAVVCFSLVLMAWCGGNFGLDAG